MSYEGRIKKYLQNEIRILKSLDVRQINMTMNVLEECRKSGHRVFVCGNGGSAATASHFVCDFNKGISYKQDLKYNFECLNDNIPMLTAIANDISYDDVFKIPLESKMTKDDLLLVISGSGNSKNIIKAMEYAKSIHAKTMAFVGFDGGKAKELADYCIHVNANNMQLVEDVHMVMDHMMMYILSTAEYV